MLLGLVSPSRRIALEATLEMWAQGYELGAGVGIPTLEQIDTACREAAASRDVGTLGIGNLRNFLKRVMEPEADHPGHRRRVGGSFSDPAL